jgi:prephenate dehydrogenase
MRKKQKIAIIGMGQFGTFMAPYLSKYYTVLPITRHSDPALLSDCEVVIFSVSYEGLLPMVKKLRSHIAPHCLIVDVMSVKEKPLQILKKHFPNHEIVGTHPIFGPQSGKSGIAGLPIVVCNVSATEKRYAALKLFLKRTLKLHVIEQTPKEHDYEMAHIQALTHFIGRTLLNLNIQSFKTNTKSYAQLLELCDLIRYDSWELFTTIENQNPQAKIVRKKFLDSLQKTEQQLRLGK